jgi:cytochrome c biogenesis protein CcmG/thiol:disulfide interchange protein DsbE
VSGAPEQPAAAPRRWLVLLPLAGFAALAVLFMFRLYSGDPSRLPSGIDATTLTGAVTLVNVWASWCVPCHDEAPLLMEMAKDKRWRMVGINQKDRPENARRFLGRYGNPFAAVGADQNGRASIEWGVYGVPETFVVDRAGKIVFKLVGPITPENLEAQVKPALMKAAEN